MRAWKSNNDFYYFNSLSVEVQEKGEMKCVPVSACLSVFLCVNGTDLRLGSGHGERCKFLVQAIDMQN